MANDRTIPGTGSPDIAKPSEPASLPPEVQARVDSARAQFGRVEKALQASGVNASGLIIKTGEGLNWSVLRGRKVEFGLTESLYKDFLRVMTPAAEQDDPLFDSTFQPDILGTVSILDPEVADPRWIVSARYSEGEYPPDEDYDSVLDRVTKLLDDLGFPPAEAPESSIDPDTMTRRVDPFHPPQGWDEDLRS